MALNQAVTSGFSASLHGLRGLAALAVVLFHWYQIFPASSRQIEPLFPEGSVLNPVSYFGFGWLGVPLFFVLSGYLLGSKVIDQRLNRGFTLGSGGVGYFASTLQSGSTCWSAGPGPAHCWLGQTRNVIRWVCSSCFGSTCLRCRRH